MPPDPTNRDDDEISSSIAVKEYSGFTKLVDRMEYDNIIVMTKLDPQGIRA